MRINKSMPAVIQWSSDDTTCCLIDPDPRRGRITFTTRFDATHFYFELSIPAKIKRTRDEHLQHTKNGDNDPSALLLRISASAVKTLTFESTTTADDDIHNKFSSRASRLTRIRLQTERNFEVLVPVNAEEPVKGVRRRSREILAKIAQISNTTDLYVYISDGDLSTEALQSISSACNQRPYQENDSKYDLKSLYGGRGAKVVSVSQTSQTSQTVQPPPSYDEVTSPPPAPVVPSNPLKRRRQMSGDDLLAKLTTREKKMFDMMEDKIRATIEKQEPHRLMERIVRLEKQNQELNEFVERIVRLEKENHELREAIGKLATHIDDQNDVISRIDQEYKARLVDNDDDLSEIRDKLDKFEDKVRFVENGDLVEDVTNDVFDRFKRRLFD